MTKTVQLSSSVLDGVVTTDKRWDTSRHIMHRLEGATTFSEEITTESESMTRANHSNIALNTFLYQPGTLLLDLSTVCIETRSVKEDFFLNSEEIPTKIQADFDKLKDYITLHQAPKRLFASRSGFKDTSLYHDSSEYGATLLLQDVGGAEPKSQWERRCFIRDFVTLFIVVLCASLSFVSKPIQSRPVLTNPSL